MGIALPTRDQVKLAQQVQQYLERYPAPDIGLKPGGPGEPATVDRCELWRDLRQDDIPWHPATPAAHARLALAVLIGTGGASRLKTCSTPGCRDVFADGSNNLSRTRCVRHLRPRRQ